MLTRFLRTINVNDLQGLAKNHIISNRIPVVDTGTEEALCGL